LPGVVFTFDLLEHVFFGATGRCLRAALLTHYTAFKDVRDLFALLPPACAAAYRGHSAEFFSRFSIFPGAPRELFLPAFIDLEP
jgi:hypothetical protein